MITKAVVSLRELERAATPAPWETEEDEDGYWPVSHRGDGVRAAVYSYVALPVVQEEADFIVAARNALPLLLDVADAARRLDERFFDGREDWSSRGLPGEVDDVHDALAALDAHLGGRPMSAHLRDLVVR